MVAGGGKDHDEADMAPGTDALLASGCPGAGAVIRGQQSVLPATGPNGYNNAGQQYQQLQLTNTQGYSIENLPGQTGAANPAAPAVLYNNWPQRPSTYQASRFSSSTGSSIVGPSLQPGS